MSYLIELQTTAGEAGYLIMDGKDGDEALENVRDQLSTADADEVLVLAVHTVH